MTEHPYTPPEDERERRYDALAPLFDESQWVELEADRDRWKALFSGAMRRVEAWPVLLREHVYLPRTTEYPIHNARCSCGRAQFPQPEHAWEFWIQHLLDQQPNGDPDV